MRQPGGSPMREQKGVNKMEHLLADPIQAFDFMVAGNSTVTLKSTKTRKHFTYKLKKAKDKAILFVSTLYGDNTSEYMYIGCIFGDTGLKTTKASKCSSDADSFKAFQWAWDNIKNMKIPAGLEVWHEGRCGKCGRKLTTPESIACGLGPVCRSK